jgi:branched-chain amino acid transport system substrate-binding protein
VLAVASTLAACGGKSDDAASGDDGGDKIKIGVTIEKTGPVPVLGTAANGIQAAAKRINADGGIDGKQVELVIRDNAGDPSKAVSNLREFEQAGIKVVLGGAFGASCAAEAPVAAKAEMTVFCISTDELPEPTDHMFGVGPGYDVTIKNASGFIKQLSSNDKAAVFADKDPSGDTSAELAPKYIEEQGMEALLERTDPGASSYKPAVQKAVNFGASVLWPTQCSPAAVTAAQEALSLGFEGNILLENCLASLDIAQAVKEFADGRIFVQAPQLLIGEPDASNPRYEAIKKYNEEIDKPDTVVGAGWDAMWMAKAAIEKAGTTDTEKLVSTLEDNFEFTGVWHMGTMTADNHRGAVTDGAAVYSQFTDDGKIVPVDEK